MNQLRIALLGNCQVQTYKLLLPLIIDRPVEVDVLDISEAHSHDQAVQAAFLDTVRDADIVLAQRTDFHQIKDDRMRSLVRGRFLTIGNFYFRGLHPDACYLGDFTHRLNRPSATHSVVILDAYRRGLDVDAAVRSFTSTTFERLGLFEAWQSSLNEMAAREAGGVIDVPCLDIMRAACDRMPAFLTMNHPSVVLLADYLERVLMAANVPCRAVNAASLVDPLASHDRFPVLDIVAEHFKLPYRTSQTWKINALGPTRFVNLPELVAAFYRSYDAVDPSDLTVHSPTDLVRALRARPDFAYLVDPTLSLPRSSALAVEARTPGFDEATLASVVRSVLNEQTGPIQGTLDEIREYMHKIHSFLEIADPKIERIVSALPELARRPETGPMGRVLRRIGH